MDYILYNWLETILKMKKFIKILAIVGTGVAIGSVAGKYLKSERKTIGFALKDLIKDSKFVSRSSEKVEQDELEFYFI